MTEPLPENTTVSIAELRAATQDNPWITVSAFLHNLENKNVLVLFGEKMERVNAGCYCLRTYTIEKDVGKMGALWMAHKGGVAIGEHRAHVGQCIADIERFAKG